MKKQPRILRVAQDDSYGGFRTQAPGRQSVRVHYDAFVERTAVIRPALIAISLAVGGGLCFSLALMRLGIDMNSPELLRYLVIAFLPLALLLFLGLIQFRLRSIVRTLVAAVVLATIMCIPGESIAYLVSEWSLFGREVFGRDNLQMLLVLLAVWALGISFCASFASFAVVRLRGAKRIPQEPDR